MANLKNYNSKDLVQFGRNVLRKIGFPDNQAYITSKILVEADLRNIHSHGIAGGSSLDDILVKKEKGGIVIGEPKILDQKYPTIFNIDAQGGLGHFATDLACNLVIETAKEFGSAKAFIYNSSHFGISGHYSEKIAQNNLAGRVTCTSPVWTKPFSEEGIYDGMGKRLGTNPIAWSIPYEEGILTLDMATTQRAVSPAIKVAKENKVKLDKLNEIEGISYDLESIQAEVSLGKGKFSEIQKKLQEELSTQLGKLPGQYVLDQNGQEVLYPLDFNNHFKQNFWIAPLGGTVFGYKGFILNMLIESDNIVGGGNPNPIPSGNQTPAGRVSQTVEAYCIDSLKPINEIKRDLRIAVEHAIDKGNGHMKLPGQKEHEYTSDRLVNGIPFSPEQVDKLTQIGKKIGVEFIAQPLNQ